jgi:hypothetical protein
VQAQRQDEKPEDEGRVPFQPRIEVSETYTSNVELAGEGFEQHDWISEITPGFYLSRQGSRLSYSVDYDLQTLFYAEDDERDDVYHNFWAEGQGELIAQRAYLDLDARYGQRTLDPADREAASNLYDTNNRTDVRSFKISPWVRQPFGDLAEGTLRYTYADTDYRNTDSTDSAFVDVEDNDARRVDAVLRSPDSDGWTWRADYLHNEVNFDEAETYKYQRTGAELGVPVASRTHLLLSAGVESDPVEDRNDDSMEESWWTVGFRMEPTSRQSFEFRTGDRYYGESYELHWRREGSRLVLAVDYTEEPSTSALLEFDDGTVTEDGIYGFDRLDTDAYIRKYLAGEITWALPRSNWRIRFYRDARDYDGRQASDGLDRDDEDILGGTADWRWRFLSRTWLETGLRWETQDLNEGDSDQGWFRVAMIRDISRRIELRIEARRLVRNSEAIDDYRDNSGLIGLRWLLGSGGGQRPDRGFGW